MTVEDPKVSVIIPVHNTAPYLPQCLDSVLSQTLQHIEVLCIEDGSTDDSPEILRAYERDDPRVRVSHLPLITRGPSAARNLGISKASGEYVAFVDSDDYIEPKMLLTMYHEAEDHDVEVVMCTTTYFNDTPGETFPRCTYDQSLPALVGGQTFRWTDIADVLFKLRFMVWNKIYRQEFLERTGIRFKEDSYYEDLLFNYQALLTAQSMRFVRQPFYHYRKGREGATTQAQSDRVFDAIAILDELEQFVSAEPDFEVLTPALVGFRFRTLLRLLYRIDRSQVEPFYESLKAAALDPLAQENPHFTPAEQEQRDQISNSDVVEYLSWAYWKARTDRQHVKRRLNNSKETNKRLKASITKLQAQVADLRASNKTLRRKLRRWRRLLAPLRSVRRWLRAGARSGSGDLGLAVSGTVRSGSGQGATATRDPKSTAKSKGRFARDSPTNLYDAADFLRVSELQRRNEVLTDGIRVRLREGEGALRIGFLVNDRAKWNGDSLLEAIADEPRMRARLYLLPSEIKRLDAAGRREAYAEEQAFFARVGAPLTELYVPAEDREVPVEEIEADVLFFQQPWGMRDYPRRMAGRTLNAYMHYGFMMMANHGMHYNLGSFHAYLWRYFTQTEGHRALHLEHDPSAYDRLVVTGYPKLDVYLDGREDIACPLWPDDAGAGRGRRVIYAPHHSLNKNSPLRMATFTWTHDLLLDLARTTPGLQWVYKPHPTLKHNVVRGGVMTAEEYRAYEQEWSDLPNAEVYDSGDYFDLFRTSDALITDSGSFLAEYLPTGRPIVWLKAPESVGLNRVGATLAEGYYHVADRDGLRATFERVVVAGDDPLAEQRAAAAALLFPMKSTAAEAVVDHLASHFGLR